MHDQKGAGQMEFIDNWIVKLSVFAVLGGWLILHEVLSIREAVGCVLVFAAVIIAQIPEKEK